jgi:hypothetical protein
MTEHPVDLAYRSTHNAWQRYWDLSTPWPEAPAERARLMAHRDIIHRTRIGIIEQYPQDRRSQQERRSLLAIIAHDEQYILAHQQRED